MKLLIGIGLAVAGIVGLLILSIIGIPYAICMAIYLLRWTALYEYFAYVFKTIGFASDIVGNVILAPLLNRYMNKGNSQYRFGSYKHTISLVIGYKYYESTLSDSGLWWYNLLEKIEKGHCQSAIMDFETKQFYIKPNQI